PARACGEHRHRRVGCACFPRGHQPGAQATGHHEPNSRRERRARQSVRERSGDPGMPLKTSKYIWHDGRMVPWEQATVHVLSHALHYGSSVFEGIRVYKTPRGPMACRLTDHMRRMFTSAKVYRMKIPYSLEVLTEACKEVVRANGLTNGAYIRP